MPPTRRKQKGAPRSNPNDTPASIDSQSAPDGSANSAALAATPNSTTTDGTTTYVSEGPTLPIIAGGATTVTGLLATSNPSSERDQRASKRRKTSDESDESDDDAGSQDSPSNPTTTPKPKQQQKQSQPPGHILNAPLYKPWTLLPAAPRAHITARFGGDEAGLEGHVVVVVFTKNQNVRSGIHKIRGLLAESGGMEKEEEGEKVLAVSAQGEGTVKLVGIVEMVRRVTKGKGEGDEWYMYTVLSSVAAEKKDGEGQDDEGEEREDDAFEPIAGAKEGERRKSPERTVPVLSVWMSRAPIPQFRSAFGEEKIRIAGE